MANNIDSIKERVRKLLDRAADQEGTPEGDACFSKAFEMMSTYGFQERDLDSPDEGDAVGHKEYVLTGAYTDKQATLLMYLAHGLHCTTIFNAVPKSTKIYSVNVFGLKRHLDRLDMLFVLLKPKMLLLANRHIQRYPSFDRSPIVRKRSFMQGFSCMMGERLTAAEGKARHCDDRYAVALLNDAEQADQAMRDYCRKHGLRLAKSNRKHQVDPDAFQGGAAAAHDQDLGQTRVGRAPALPS